jgi:hypothetical protein
MGVRSLAAGGAYFAVIFASGFALGVVRVMITAPLIGETPAVLLEIPIILAASWFAAGWCIRRFGVRSAAADRLGMGFTAFALTLMAELGVSIVLFGRTLSEHLAIYGDFPGLAGLAAQILFALIPFIQARRGSAKAWARPAR